MKQVEEKAWKGLASLFHLPGPVIFRKVISEDKLSEFTMDNLCRAYGKTPVKVVTTDKGLVPLESGKGHYYHDLSVELPFEEAINKLASETVASSYIPRLPINEQSGLLRSLPFEDAPLGQNLLVSTLWIGPRDNRLSMHHDFADNLFSQLVGHKKFVLLSPDFQLDLFRQPITGVGTRPMWHGTTIREVESTTGLPTEEFFEADLGPGDVLWLPNLWWHEVTSLSTPTISAASWWSHLTMAEIQARISEVTQEALELKGLPRDWKERVGAPKRDP